MEKKTKRELRAFDVTPIENEDNQMIVEGRAIVFNSPTVLYEYDGIQYKETIDARALDGADMSDVPFKYNHTDSVMIMARTRNRTLTLTKDEKGLNIRAIIANTSTGKDLYELIRRGDVDKMSFAFTTKESSYNKDTHTRTILKIDKLFDVSAVDIPAYNDTSIHARDFFKAEAEKEALESERAEKRKAIDEQINKILGV